jgi:hypothetical protein
MSGGGLRVDPDGVRAAAARATASAVGGPPALAVTPCAADTASHAAASRLAVRAAAVLAATAALEDATAAAGGRLSANAEMYVAQDITGAAGLRPGVGLGSATAASVSPAASPRVVPPVAVVGAGGVRPATGKQAAELIHGGSTAGMLAVADALDRHAARCEEAAAGLGAARVQARDSWSSATGDAADARLGELVDGYAGQVRAARELADEMRSHAVDFGRARARIPAPQVFGDLEARAYAGLNALGAYGQTYRDPGGDERCLVSVLLSSRRCGHA